MSVKVVGVALVFLVMVTPVFAQLNSNTRHIKTDRATISGEKREPSERVLPKREVVKERIKTRREEVSEKLENIKDTRRKELAEKVHDRMCTILSNRTSEMSRHLATMSNILARVEQNGSDDPQVVTAVANAKTAISTAQSAVDELAAADCGLEISGSEEGLKTEIKAAHQRLLAQLKAVHDKVGAARKAVGLAITALKGNSRE